MVAIKQFKTDEGQVFASIFSEAGQSLLMNVCKGHGGSEQDFNSVIKFSLAQMKHKKLKYWLSDLSEVESNTVPDVKSLLDKLVIRLKGSQLKKFSLVSNTSLGERRHLENIISKSGVEFKTFSNFAKASEWLLVPDLESKEWEESQIGRASCRERV